MRAADGVGVRPAVSPEEAIAYLCDQRITLTWDPAAGTLQAGTSQTAKTAIRKAS
jgi:hypothetical protein